MSFQVYVAIVGGLIGFVLMLFGTPRESHRELRIVGGFLLIASFCYLLGFELPNLW